MKKLKYLKLFEAFQSERLSKTLAYINSKSKNEFLEYLKKITQQSDFPLSELSDDLFQYLPYKRALSIHNKSPEKTCQATSNEIFNSNGIDGEKCESGRIKRKWGSSTRIVTCERCSGTGIEPPVSDIQYIKFWFTQHGELVCVSATDGIQRSKRDQSSVFTDSQLRNAKRLTPINQTDRDFRQQLQKMSDGTPVEFIHTDSRRTHRIRGYIYHDPRQGSGQIYFIHDDSNCDGSTPYGSGWQKFGRYSWSLRGGEFDMIIPLEIEVDQLKDEEDPFEWNVLVSIDSRKISIRSITRYDNKFEQMVEPAHFALILDLHKLKSKNFKPASQTSSERDEMKAGATKLMTDDEIKKQNIERYLKQIVQKSDFTQDITVAKNVLKRFTGSNFPLYYLIQNTRTPDYINSLITRYHKILTVDQNSNEFTEAIMSLQDFIKTRYKYSTNDVSIITKNLTGVKNLINDVKFEDFGPVVSQAINNYYFKSIEEYKTTMLDLIEKLSKFNLTIYNKLNSITIETIEDLEIYSLKVKLISHLLNRNDYNKFWKILNFCEMLGYEYRGQIIPQKPFNVLNNDGVIGSLTEIHKGIDSLCLIVERM